MKQDRAAEIQTLEDSLEQYKHDELALATQHDVLNDRHAQLAGDVMTKQGLVSTQLLRVQRAQAELDTAQAKSTDLNTAKDDITAGDDNSDDTQATLVRAIKEASKTAAGLQSQFKALAKTHRISDDDIEAHFQSHAGDAALSASASAKLKSNVKLWRQNLAVLRTSHNGAASDNSLDTGTTKRKEAQRLDFVQKRDAIDVGMVKLVDGIQGAQVTALA